MHPTLANRTARLRWIGSIPRRLWRVRRARPGSDPDAGGARSGLHAVRRPADLWFEERAAELEASAVAMAQAAAAAKLPRADVEYESVPEEEDLITRACAIFRGWTERVRTHVQDAVQRCAERADARLSAYEHELVELELAESHAARTARDLERAEAELPATHAAIEVRRFFARWKYWTLITLLVLVDWVANVPVFSELLPSDPGAEAAWRQVVADSEQLGILGGAYRVVARTLHQIDASVLALGVIVFLVFLAHVFGESMRRRTSMHEAEEPSAATTIRGHRRQFGLAALASLAGILTVVAFLWLAREQLERSTAERVAQVEAQVAELQAALADARAAGDLERIGTAERQLDAALRVRDQRLERADYANVIARMNEPILLLNIVLAIAAALAAYLATHDSVRGRPDNPHAAELRRELRELRHECARRRRELARLDTCIRQEFAAASYLLNSRPLQGWEAKADRLRAVIPRFRAENARARGIDTANIAAFRRPGAFHLAPREEDGRLTPPAELLRQQQRFERLRRRAAALIGDGDPEPWSPASAMAELQAGTPPAPTAAPGNERNAARGADADVARNPMSAGAARADTDPGPVPGQAANAPPTLGSLEVDRPGEPGPVRSAATPPPAVPAAEPAVDPQTAPDRAQAA